MLVTESREGVNPEEQKEPRRGLKEQKGPGHGRERVSAAGGRNDMSKGAGKGTHSCLGEQ